MLTICVCEDEERDRAVLCSAIERMLQSLGISGRTLPFSRADDLLAQYPAETDVLLLDIQMPGTNGMDAARAIRARDDDVRIVFMTSLAEYAIDGYSVQAYDYLLKPIDPVRLESTLAPLFRKVVAAKQASIVCTSRGQRAVVHARTIVSVETARNKSVVFHTTRGDVETKGSLGSFAEKLDAEQFFRCHTSFIVNFAFVERVTATEVWLADGSHVPLSKHRRQEMDRALAHYLAGRL